MNHYSEQLNYREQQEAEQFRPNTSFTDDPEDGATEEEYTAARARETGDDFNVLREAARASVTLVKLFTVAIRFACDVKTTDCVSRDGRKYKTRAQIIFTIHDNRILLNLTDDATFVKRGNNFGLVHEIYGTNFTEAIERDDATHTNYRIRFVQHALPVVKRDTPQPRPFPPAVNRTKIKHLQDLQGQVMRLRSELESDDTCKNALTRDIAEITRQIAILKC